MNKIAIKRGSAVVLELPLDDKAVYSSQVMGEEYIETTLSATQTLQLQIGDRLLHKGVEYVLFEEPDHTHQDGVHTYPIRFYAPYYVFGFVKHKHQDAIDISYCGTLEQHLTMLLSDVEQAWTGSGATAACYTGFRTEWGSVDKTAVQHIEFGDVTCLEALGKICETYGLEYRFSGKSLYLSPAEQAIDPDAAYPAFEYGKGKGLYSLERQGISNESVATRLFVYGSDRNLPPNYRLNDTPRPVKLTIAGRHLDANTALYGVREQTVTNDEIFPRLKDVQVVGTPKIGDKICTFRIRFAKAADVFELADNVIKDREPKVSFTTGALTGEEFTIVKGGWRKVDTTTREIDIIRSEIEYEGATHYLPGNQRIPAEGDEFVLFDLNMPAQYVTRAEAELREWGQKQLEKKSIRQYSYRLEIDPRHVKRQGLSLAAGDRIRVTDGDASRVIRISGVTYPLLKPTQLSVELNDIKVGTFAEKVEQEIQDVTGSVQQVHRQAGAISRRAWRDAQELAALTESLSAPGLITGDAEGQFTCSSVIRCNMDDDPNKIVITDGELKHALYAPAEGSGWKITGGEQLLEEADFPLDKPIFLYAVCSLTSNSAYIGAAPEMPSEEVPAHRFFQVGILSSVYKTGETEESEPVDGTEETEVTYLTRRTFNYTNRYSQIVGGNITTSVISDPARRLVIDLDNARITAAEGAEICGRIDLTNSTVNGKTIIDGGRIKADSIDTDSLTVKQLQTSENADKRIVISKKDHSITMYNDLDQMRLEVSGETKNTMADIVNTGGGSSGYVSLSPLDVTANAMLLKLSTDYSNTATENDTIVAYGPFTISGSVKPSLAIPAIRPTITFVNDCLTGDSGWGDASFTVTIEKKDDTGIWKKYQGLGTLRKSTSEIKYPIPRFSMPNTLHNIAPGTYRIVYAYSLKSTVSRFYPISPGRPGENVSGGGIDAGKAHLTPITSGNIGQRVAASSLAGALYEPIKPIDPPGPVIPPIKIESSKMETSLQVYSIRAHMEYSILRTSIFANGMASVWAPNKYFRILNSTSETNLIEARGTTQLLPQAGSNGLQINNSGLQLLSPNGYNGLQITNEGFQMRYKNAPWGGMMPPVDYIGHVTEIGTFTSQWRIPGKNPMGVNRVKTGNYKITFSSPYTYSNDYIILVSSFWGYGRMISCATSECVLYLGDDASANNAEFYFIVLNVRNYLS